MSKTTILFFASNPDDTFPLNLAEEVRQIEQSIRAAEYRDHIDFRSKWAVQAKDLLDELDVYKPPVVHFSGHGDQNGIFLHDASGKSKLLPRSGIVPLRKENLWTLLCATTTTPR